MPINNNLQRVKQFEEKKGRVLGEMNGIRPPVKVNRD